MTDRPILFSGPMVRALLDGRKTQTRRIVKPQPSPDWAPPEEGIAWRGEEFGFTGRQRVQATGADGEPDVDVEMVAFPVQRCPYGVPGDRLWVREAFAQPNDQVAIYRANWREDAEARGLDNIPADDSGIRWRPSIHIPRLYSRLTLTITDVRVQRLREISDADALAEGIIEKPDRIWWVDDGDPLHGFGSPRTAFAELWNHINGPNAWDANPWVWALTFDVAHRNIDGGAA